MNVKVFTRLRGIFLLKWAVCCLFLSGTLSVNAQNFYFFNDGAVISVKPATPFVIKSTTGDRAVLRNGGYLSNESEIIIEGSFENYTVADTTEGVGADAAFFVTKDWTNNGTFIKGQSTVFLNGVNQEVKGSVPTPFHNLTLTGSGIKTLKQNASVAGLLTLNDLELATDTNTMTVLNTDSAAILRTTGFVSSLHGGTLERAMNNDTTRYYYPLGSSQGTPRYRPLVIQSTDTVYTIMGARLGNNNPDQDEYYRDSLLRTEICQVNPNYYHQIERTTPDSVPVDITMFYNPAEDGLWSQISHWQNKPQWELARFSTPGADSLYSTLTLHNWNDFTFSPFALTVPPVLLDGDSITHVTCNGGSDGSICVGNPITGTPPFHYQWSTSPNDTLNCIVDLRAGTYTLTVSDAFNCPNPYTFVINEPAAIDIDVDTTHISCNGFADGVVCVNATRGTETFTYRWIDGVDSNCHTGLIAFTHGITITDAIGCTVAVSATVTEPDELVVSPEAINVSCYGFGDGQGIANVTGGTPPYYFLWSTEDSIETQTIDDLLPETYSVTVTDTNGCTATSTMNINQPDSLIVTAGNDTATFTGYSVTLYVAGITGGNGSETYQWTPVETVDNPQSATTAATPGDDTPYVITVSDANGCTATDTLFVQVDENLYTFPDGFVPNGQNNIFMPVTSSTVTVLKLEIFNRWGQLVGNNPAGWDGKHNGELQPMDTYIYQAVLQLPDNSEKTERGDFILIW